MRRRRASGGVLAEGGTETTERAATALDRLEGDYYGGVLVGAETIGSRALSPRILGETRSLLDALADDDYSRYLRDFLEAGATAAGEEWRYADLLTSLAAACELVKPRDYLEIGVRSGRSLAVVAQRRPTCSIVGVDLWLADYAGMPNRGPAFVERELARLGFTGALELIEGDSHTVLPQLFRERPGIAFDLVTVDGDHSSEGAERDLVDVLPRLRVGGALVFDDIRHPAHPDLDAVWRRVVESDRRYSTWRFDDVGFGVAVAVRRW